MQRHSTNLLLWVNVSLAMCGFFTSAGSQPATVSTRLPGALAQHDREATGSDASDRVDERSLAHHSSVPDAWPVAPADISPVDLSFLNRGERPAGKHGFLRAEKDSLVFDDGHPARFWGTNLTSRALFQTDRENVRRQASRLSQLGFNLVRFHHHDSYWVNPNVFGDRNQFSTAHLDPKMMDKLDWWIQCLKEQGIYVWLDLHVQRELKPGDGIEDFEELRKKEKVLELKGYNYVNRSIEEAMARFNDAYVNHVNVYSGLKYKDEPAIAAMLVTNENDLTHHFGNALLPDKGVPRHTARYMADALEFASKYRLPKDKIWRAWEPGPSKIFLNDLERRFDVRMIERLRELGVKVPIVTTSSFGASPLSSLPALTAGDLIAVHSYGRAGELKKNPNYEANMMDWIAAAQVIDKPLVVPEWNVEPFPVADRHTIPLYLAASGALQGWDGIMQYAYAQQPLSGPGFPSNWDAFNDPSLLSTMPAAALLYRRQDVREAKGSYVFAPTRGELFDRALSPANLVSLRTAAERGKVAIALPETPELPWLRASEAPSGATAIHDQNRSFLDVGADEVTSDTGELYRSWKDDIFTINTPRTQAAMGSLGRKKIALADVTILASTSSATIAVQSLDDLPISNATAVMITVGGRSIPQAAKRLPFRSEPVAAHLTVKARSGLKLHAIAPGSQEKKEIAAPFIDGVYHIELASDFGAYWLELR